MPARNTGTRFCSRQPQRTRAVDRRFVIHPSAIPLRRFRALIAVFAASLLLLATAACGGDSSDKNASALFAISAIDAAGMHEVDQDIQTGTIPATAESVATHLQTAFLVTTWPTELKSPAAKAAALFGTMAGTLSTDKPDLAKVQAASAAAHAAWHQFSELAWTYLGTKAGVKNANAPTPSADHHH